MRKSGRRDGVFSTRHTSGRNASPRDRSNVTLHLPADATLLQSKNMDDYEIPPKSCYVHGTGSRRIFLHGDKVQNVSLVGEGTIDGNLALDSHQGDAIRRGPLPILFENSRNILIKDITVRNSPSWAITFFGCNKVDVIRVKCLDSYADGINPVCSQFVCLDEVLIEGSKDDPIAIKNEMSGMAPECGFLTENIVIRNSTIRNCGHPAVKIGTGTFGIFRDIAVKNCTFEDTGAMLTIQLMSPNRKDTPKRAIENISFTDIAMKNVSGLIDVTSLTVDGPIIRNISLQNIVAQGLKGRSAVWGLPEAPIENVTLRNITVTGSAKPVRYWYCDMLPRNAKPLPYWLKTRHVRSLTLSDVKLLLDDVKSVLISENGSEVDIDGLDVQDISGKKGAGPVLTLKQVKGVSIRNCKGPASRTFLHVEGSQTSDIHLANNDWGENQTPLDIAEDLSQRDMLPPAGDPALSNLESSKQIVANESFMARVTVTNTGNEGAFKAEVHVDGKLSGSHWLWLKEGESRPVTLTTRPCYLPGNYKIRVGYLAASGEVLSIPAAIEFGERMKIESPAAAGKQTLVTVPLKNIGGQAGTKLVKLLADGEAVASTHVTLAPGEEKEITLQHRFQEEGPHKLKIGDFPVWPYATFANTAANFYQTREKIIIEAGGGEHQIQKPDRQYAALYLKDVEGDFVATATLSVRHVTGPYCGGGLIVKNNMTDPVDHSGCVVDWFYPKYAVCHYEDPQLRQITKTGRRFSALHRISTEDADSAQDVGIFVHAFSARGELCHVEFDHFTLEQQ